MKEALTSSSSLQWGIIILANAFPAIGALLLGWSTGELVVLYWLENIIIGLFHALLILLKTKSFLPIFFIVHYGGFCLGHGVFVNMIWQNAKTGAPFTAHTTTSLPFTDPELWSKWMIASVAAFFIYQATAYVKEIYQSQHIESSKKLLMRPYKRIIILHVAIIIGAFASFMLGHSIAVLLLIVVGKTLADLKSAKSLKEKQPQV